MENTSVEISIHGKWFTVPAVEVNGNTIALTGKWLKLAVIHEEDYLETELQDPEVCIRKLKEQQSRRYRADIFTFTQKLPATLPRFSYSMEWESIAAVRTASFKEWWESLPQESRKNVRRAQKRGVGMAVKQLDDDLVREIVDLNNDSPTRQGRPFVHYSKAFDQVKKDQSSFPGRSDYVCAYFGNELIGFLKIAYRGEVASIVQILPKASHHEKRPANALIARAVELCEAKRVSYLTYGLFNYGNKSDSPLRQFKVRNGFQEILVPRFYVPLTVWGRACIKLKLYRGLIGILPDRVVRVGVSVRAKWYGLSALVRSRCSSMAERPNCNRQTERSNPPAGSNT
jgi:hypothetical protein